MDNGQVSQNMNENRSAPVFFTSGAGIQPEEVNPDKSESINTSNFPEQNQYDYGKVGNIAIGELTPSPKGELVPRPEQMELSVDEIEFEAPEIPEMPKPSFEVISEEPSTTPINTIEISNIINTGTLRANSRDRLSSAALKTIKKGVHEFETGEITPANLVDLREAASRAYLKNSYNRDIGEAA